MVGGVGKYTFHMSENSMKKLENLGKVNRLFSFGTTWTA
jgi:hypothetical protein